MKFSNIVVVMAAVIFTAQATAQSQTVTPNPAPVADSAADAKVEAIKKVRQDVEKKNDDKIVEKLEKTRLEDEKDLSKKIDSTDLKSDDSSKQQDQTVKVEVVQPAAPIAPVVEEKKEEKKDSQWYAGAGIGNVIYNGNVLTKSSFGAMVGKMLDQHLAIEGSLIYSKIGLNNYWNGGGAVNYLFGQVDQYDLALAVKYYVLDSKSFRPYVGASGDYILREYSTPGISTGVDNQATNSFNVALIAGMDVRLTDSISIGGEFKYSLPVFTADNGIVSSSYWEAYAKPLEQSSFTSWLIDLKYAF